MRHISVRKTAYVVFEPDEEELARIARDAGFQAIVERQERVVLISLAPEERRPLFFDAADSRQGGRLAAARTFANGASGVVFNTPFVLEAAAGPDGSGVRIRLCTEVRWDIARKFPQGACETSLLALFQQLVQDLSAGMVGLCGLPPRAHAGVMAKTAP